MGIPRGKSRWLGSRGFNILIRSGNKYDMKWILWEKIGISPIDKNFHALMGDSLNRPGAHRFWKQPQPFMNDQVYVRSSKHGAITGSECTGVPNTEV